jgi:organic radical activating enzyme
MSKIKVSELFYSIQGEGRYMGVPSIFLRTFGCNFTCQGFGMPRGMLSEEADVIANEQKQTNKWNVYDELPLVSTGCDSYASWHPAFKELSPVYDTDEIANNIVNLLPHREWRDEHLVITGGEPLLGWQRSYPDLLDHPLMAGLKSITFETNGTQMLSNEFKRFLWVWSTSKDREVTFSVSAKLSCSGESHASAILPSVVCCYEKVGFTYLKFVIATDDDANEALEVIKMYRTNGFKGPVYLMPVGGVNEVYNLNSKNVADLALKHGLRYSDRLHLPLFGNSWGT